MTYASGCKCHGETFCPDFVCIGFDDDVPVYVNRNTPEGKEAVARADEMERKIDRETFDRLRSKYGWQ